jgi:hypothetical protein
MKTVKFILPVVAIMVAVAGVFATENSAPAVDLVDVTARSSATCIIDGTCDIDITTKKCKLASGVQFQEYISSTSCSNPVLVGAFVAILNLKCSKENWLIANSLYLLE